MGAIVLGQQSSENLYQILEQYFTNFLSENTRASYLSDLKDFTLFAAAEQFGIRGPEQILPVHIIKYRDHLRKQFSPATVNRRLSTLSSLFKELTDRQIVANNPVLGIKRPSNQTVRPTLGFSDSEVQLILDSFTKTQDISLIQRKAIFCFLFYTAARISELRLCKVQHFDIATEPWSLSIVGKGNKMRKIAVHPLLREAVADLCEARNKNANSFLFTSTRSSENKPLSRMALHDLIKRQLLELGIDPTRSAHSSRRTVISNLLENGEQLQEVQRVAGHSSPTTTLRYNVREVSLQQSPLLRIDFEPTQRKKT